MARGRGSAAVNGVVLGAVVLIAFLVLSAPPLAEAAKYTVGNGGWKFGAESWTRGRAFRAGDVLEFKYNKALHDVAKVDAAAYRSCTVPRRARKMRSGHDKVPLGKGMHYFICTEPGHCKAGMKIAVMAY